MPVLHSVSVSSEFKARIIRMVYLVVPFGCLYSVYNFFYLRVGECSSDSYIGCDGFDLFFFYH